MGREIKRVPMDFDWPVGEVWASYLINMCPPEPTSCDKCRHAARLRGMVFTDFDCPNYEPMLGPPKGDGWQMWETISKGSPISPVCESPEALAKWLVENNTFVFGHETATYEQWMAIVKAGWVPNAVADTNILRSWLDAISSP